ncbi:hypothetical protein QRN89_00015 [Streptomyces chengbuensis]|uniref:Secreted protein n=1 Tax=Streptomyces wuyuanensis TaxID=1196353 RepID=A0A1H0DIH0_9ACTN|nr:MULTISPECIES: hypothetical protein [Streptomyces]WJY48349.1 hypothetical protein QRN89_00015 [Streptomyces sp. HUAS CB01]SDN69945.1 hypothetical protein SAMN05444921_13416 [Streptomyces wuyuanensis]
MRIPALSVAVAVVAATIAGGAAPAAADTLVSTVNLEAGAGLHHNSATVTYERVDGAVNSVKIISLLAFSSERDCVWVEWNDPNDVGDGWAALNSEPPCYGGNLGETLNRIIKAPKGHQLKVRLAAYHDGGIEVIHKDIAKL